MGSWQRLTSAHRDSKICSGTLSVGSFTLERVMSGRRNGSPLPLSPPRPLVLASSEPPAALLPPPLLPLPACSAE